MNRALYLSVSGSCTTILEMKHSRVDNTPEELDQAVEPFHALWHGRGERLAPLPTQILPDPLNLLFDTSLHKAEGRHDQECRACTESRAPHEGHHARTPCDRDPDKEEGSPDAELDESELAKQALDRGSRSGWVLVEEDIGRLGGRMRVVKVCLA